jgi:DNA-binding response OmpR family regulator
MKVLIVEDEKALRTALTARFEREGFEVLEAPDGKEGLAIALREHPHMILLDIIMPVMDGLTMLDLLRENAWGRTAPVIALTNLSEWGDVNHAVDKNVHDYLVKSDWSLDDIVKKVRSKLQAGST